MNKFIVSIAIFSVALLAIGAATARNGIARSAAPQSDMDDDGTMPSYHAHAPTEPALLSVMVSTIAPARTTVRSLAGPAA